MILSLLPIAGPSCLVRPLLPHYMIIIIDREAGEITRLVATVCLFVGVFVGVYV